MEINWKFLFLSYWIFKALNKVVLGKGKGRKAVI